MLKKTAYLAATVVAALGLAACDVQKTQEGNVTLPNYKVEKTQEGSAKLPAYDVKTPEVTVDTKEKKVEVPTIAKEERTVKVPEVEVTPAKEK